MHATLTIQMDNDAFVDDPAGKLARILRDLASRLENRGSLADVDMIARDANGNAVGSLEIKED